jgi:hypothetical protein
MIFNLPLIGFVKRVCILPLLFLLVTLSSNGQDSSTVKKWNFLLEPYMMFPNMKGTTGVGTLPDASLDVDAGDIFSHLKFGAMVCFEAWNERWAFTTDLIYMKLGQDVKQSALINNGEVTVKQFAWELAALRKLLPWLEGGIGLRLNSLNVEADLVTNNIVGGGTTARNKSLTQTWVDPIIIARIKSAAGNRFIYQFRGDIGGFGIGADLAWQIQAYAGYRFSRLFQLTGGFRVLSVDYNNGTGEDRFLYDIDTFGPVIRFGFNF